MEHLLLRVLDPSSSLFYSQNVNFLFVKGSNNPHKAVVKIHELRAIVESLAESTSESVLRREIFLLEYKLPSGPRSTDVHAVCGQIFHGIIFLPAWVMSSLRKGCTPCDLMGFIHLEPCL